MLKFFFANMSNRHRWPPAVKSNHITHLKTRMITLL